MVCMKSKKNAWKYIITLLPFLILVLMFEAVPLLTIVRNAFKPVDGTGFTLGNFPYLFSKKTYQQALMNSVIISLLSAAIGLAVAFFGALAATSVKSKMRKFFMSVLNMTSNFSGIPLALAYIIMLGNVGVFILFAQRLNFAPLADFDLYSRTGLIMVYIYFQIPLSTLLLIPAFAGIRKEWKESAALMKAHPWQFWWHVGIPVLLPSIVGTFSVLIANALAAYATAYALMINNYPLLAIKISGMFVGEVQQQKELGSALSVVLMLLMSAAILVNNYLLSRSRKAGQ